VAPSVEVPGELGTWTSQDVEANVFIIVYAGKVYSMDDPNLPKDKTYQQIIPGSRRVIDASHFPKLGTGYRINQSFNDNRINVRAYACSKSPKVINYNILPTLIYYFFQRETKTLFFTRLFVESRPELSALRGMGEITG